MSSNYVDEVPESVDKTQEEWEKLSYSAQYYHAKPGRKEKQKKKLYERREEKRDWVRKLKSDTACRVCEEDEPVCLDFHHKGDKDIGVSNLIHDHGKKKILEEIRKCVVVCSNCHRKIEYDIIDDRDLETGVDNAIH